MKTKKKDELAKKIRALRDALGLKQTEFAARIGARQDLVSKWERGEHAPGAEYAAKMADLAGVPLSRFVGAIPVAKNEISGRTVKVVGELQAGAWKEAIEWDYDDQFDIPYMPAPGVPSYPVRAFIVRGTSMNRLYPDGTLVFVASTIANKIKPANGHKVLVQRRNADGFYEATIKELVVDDHKRKWLWPRSFDPEYQAPIEYLASDGDTTITGVVVQATIGQI